MKDHKFKFVDHLRLMSPIELWSSMEDDELLVEFLSMNRDEQILFMHNFDNDLTKLVDFYAKLKSLNDKKTTQKSYLNQDKSKIFNQAKM